VVLVHGVAVKPGKPTIIGKLDDNDNIFLFGLPDICCGVNGFSCFFFFAPF